MRVARILATLALLPCAAAAQAVQTAVLPDTATVGDVVRVAVRVVVPPDARVVFPDSLPVRGDVENAARPQALVDTLEDGTLARAMVYGVTAWRPGETPLPAVEVEVSTPGGGVRRETVTFPPLQVRSVLPPDTAGVEPKPPRGVLGPSRLWWPWVVLLMVVAVAAVAAYLWYRRRTPPPPVEPLVPAIAPRDRALQALDRARTLGLLDAGRFKAFYSLVSEALRHYVAALDPRRGEDLTTTELVAVLRGDVPQEDLRVLASLLAAADLVKFARHQPTAAEAEETWARARDWVQGYPPPVAPEVAA